MTHKERRVLIKANAKERLKSNNSNPYLGTLIIAAVMIGIVILAIISIAVPLVMGVLMQAQSEYNPMGAILIMGGNISNTILNIIMPILFSILMIGFGWYTFKIYRGEENRYRDIFSGFSVRGLWIFCSNFLAGFFEGILALVVTLIVMVPVMIIIFSKIIINMGDAEVLMIIFTAMIAIWILSIPVYIIAYGLRLINYIMYDDSKINAFNVLFKSWKMMKGHKWELFKLDLTFIGWYIITVITLGIAGIYTMPYFYTVYAGFYEEIKKEYVD